jgi:peroxiredoxin
MDYAHHIDERSGMPLQIGDKAPDFETWSTRGGEKVGDKIKLSDRWKNHKALVLAFFPLAFTPG